jgi:hypothetical protein
MTKEAAIYIGFSDELSKMAILGTALALGGAAIGAGVLGHKMLQKEKQRRKAFTKRLTGTYQPGAGMIAPPRSY